MGVGKDERRVGELGGGGMVVAGGAGGVAVALRVSLQVLGFLDGGRVRDVVGPL